MTKKTVDIPEELWVDFIDILYTSIQHITHTEKNEKIMLVLRQIVGDAFHNEEVLVVDGKIVHRDFLRNETKKKRK